MEEKLSIIPFSQFELIDSQNVVRTGLIVYDSSNLNMLMGRKIYNNKLTDFGGGCKLRKKETPINCLIREVKEELGYTIDLSILRSSAWVILVKTRDDLIYASVWLPTTDSTFNTFINNFKPNPEILQLISVPYQYAMNVNNANIDSSFKFTTKSIQKSGIVLFGQDIAHVLIN
jgi:hypothetical protein